MADLPAHEFETLDISIQNKVAHIQLNQPQRLNSMTPAFWHDLPDAVMLIDAHSAARVIVISSTGKHFSAGMDLAVFQTLSKDFAGEPARQGERMRRMVLELQDSFNALEQVRVPVLAAVQGGAIGGAVDMLCACDMRYCTEDAFFTIKETEIGMTADVGTLQRLPHLIPQGLVRELAYTGRNMGCQEALSCGFVNSVHDSQESMLEHVMQIAQRIATHSPMAVAGCKHMINYTRDHSVKDSLDYMATWQSGMFQMPDLQAALEAQKAKTIPDFEELHPNTARMMADKE